MDSQMTGQLDDILKENNNKKSYNNNNSINNNNKYSWDTNANEIETNIKLIGKNVIVTGGYNGIGYETSKVFAERGARVIIAGRDNALGAKAVEEIKRDTGNENVSFIELDLASLDSVRSFAAKFNSLNIPLNYLINNAGVMGCPKSITKDGFETQFQVNYLSHYLLTNLLLSRLIDGAPARVVNVASSGHNFSNILWDDINFDKTPYTHLQGYGQSKTAQILFSVELNKRYKDKGVISNALHPGNIQTALWRHMTPEILSDLPKEPGFANAIKYSSKPKTPLQGASTTLYAALSPNAEGGKFYDDCNEAIDPAVNPYAVDEQASKRLWELSEKWVGLK